MLNFPIIRIFLLFFIWLLIEKSFAQSPNADFSANTTKGCPPLLVTFSDNSSDNPDTWLWDFGNGNTSNYQNPSAIFITPGIYTISLTVSNTSGSDTIIKSAFIEVYPKPVVGFTSDTVSGCVPFTINFFDQSTSSSGTVNTWFWNFGDGGSSTQKNPSRTYLNEGNYTVYLLCKNSYGCQEKIIKSGYIFSYRPVAKFNFSTVCYVPSLVNFMNSSQGINLSNFWTLDDSTTSNQTNPVHTFDSSGNYNVSLQITDIIGCKDSISKPVVINEFIADFNYTVSCSDSDFTIEFKDASSSTAKVWFWNFGDGDSSALQNPIHTYNSISPYTITLIAGIDSSCTDTVTKTYMPPDAQFIPDKEYLCGNPFIVNFTDISTGTSPLTYQWDFGDNIQSSDSDAVHTYIVPVSVYLDSFFVRLIVTNTWNCSDTLNDTIFIQKPVLSFIADPDRGCIPLTVNFKDTTISNDSLVNWEWNFGDGSPVSNIQNPTHTYIDTGHYTVTLITTTFSGCKDTLAINNFILSGILPDFIDFSILPDDTTCHHRILSFLDLSGYLDTNIKINYWCWVFHYYNFYSSWYTGKMPDLKEKCKEQGFFEVHTSPATIQNPDHDYDELFIKFGKSIIGGDTLWYDYQHIGKFGFDTIYLIAGYNGCTDTTYKTIFIHPPTAYPGFIFPDSTELASCSSPATFGFFNGSMYWDTLIYYYIIHQQSGDTIYNFATQGFDSGFLFFIEDTIPKLVPYKNITFTRAGNYGIYISVYNDSTNCLDARYRELTIDSVRNGFTIVPDVSCLRGNVITFKDTSVSFFGSVTGWKWVFGDGDSLSGSAKDTIYPQDTHDGRTTGSYNNPTHRYLDTGTFIIRSEITVDVPYKLMGAAKVDYLKCFYETSDTVKIYNIYPGFTADTTKGCSGMEVFFTDFSVSVAPVSRWLWDFGDSTMVDTNQNPSHIYNSPGSYDVMLWTEDTTGCSDTVIKKKYISISDPIANFSPDTPKVCLGDSFWFFTQPVSFYNSSTGDSLTFFWNFGDGFTSILKEPAHTYTGAGIYSVSLIVYDTTGCSDTIVKQDLITVFDHPEAGFYHSVVSIDCMPKLVSFTDTSKVSIKSRFWAFGDGQSSSEQNPVHVYTNNGINDVSLFVTDSNGCKNIELKSNLLNIEGPTGTFTFTPDSGCTPLDVDFTSNAKNTDFYFWDFGDGSPFGTRDSMVHTFTLDGNFVPSLVLSDSSGCTLIILSDTIIYVAKFNPGFSAGDTIICNPDSMRFTDLTSPAPTSWFWDFGDGATSILKNPIHFYDSAGEYSVLLTVTSPECTVTVSKPGFIIIYDTPAVKLTSSDSDGCTPFPVQFNAAVTPGVSFITGYEWNFGDGVISDSSQNNSHIFTTQGDYTVKLKITFGKGECTISDSVPIKANTPPDAIFITDTLNPSCLINRTFQFHNKSTNSNSHLWNFGDGTTSAEQDPVYTYRDTGYFTVNLSVLNQLGCADTTLFTIYVFDYSGVIKIPNVFTPNNDGINDLFHIEGSDKVQVSGMIFNRWGMKLFEWNDPKNQWDGTFNGKEATEGVYYFIITICNEVQWSGFVHVLR